jgi:superfamily II DNA/RNA helicase
VTETQHDEVETTTTTFDSLNLHPQILKALHDCGYDTPTPVQAQAIPALLQGTDLMVCSQTGSGKTAAFMLPALHKLAEPSQKPGRGPRMLVLSPTRELAQQISLATQKYGKFLRRINIVSVLGGMPYPTQNRLLAKPHDILVATPGRLLDHMQHGRIDFSRLEMLVLDEADRMLDMGFIDDVRRIVMSTPATRQTLLFSATLDRSVAQLARQMLKDPVRIETSSEKISQPKIEQRMYYVDDSGHKIRILDHLLKNPEIKQAIIFTSTKRYADVLADTLNGKGHSVAALHGDMRQTARNRTLTDLRTGRLRVLVATDVAARGIDIPGISHVINYDLPKLAEDYVHRIGRTARAGNEGIAISMAALGESVQVKRIERFTGQPIAAHEIAGLEPRFKPINIATAAQPGPRGSRPSSRPRLGGGGGGRSSFGSLRTRSFGASR